MCVPLARQEWLEFDNVQICTSSYVAHNFVGQIEEMLHSIKYIMLPHSIQDFVVSP